MSDITFFANSPFKIKRPLITTNGLTSDLDAKAATLLAELNQLLSKPFIAKPPTAFAVAAAKHPQTHTAAPLPSAATQVTTLLSMPLSPKHQPPEPKGSSAWETGSLLDALSTNTTVGMTLTDFIDMTAPLASLKYDFANTIVQNWPNLNYNITAVLDSYPAISDYLIAYGFLVQTLTDVRGLANFVLSNSLGAKNVANYAIVSGARVIIDNDKLQVPSYNDNAGAFVPQLQSAAILLSSASFETQVKNVVDNYVFNAAQLAVINAVNPALKIPQQYIPQLVLYLKANPFVDATNAQFFLPVYLQQITGTAPIPGADAGAPPGAADQDFNVDYLADDQTTVQVSQTAVRCAAQLYYSMILGDELDVFDAINYFTHKYLIRGTLEISDATLRDDLQLYVFSSKFTDLKTQRINDRSRPAERQMFYRQVFNWGKGQVTEDVVVNREFNKLWKVMMLESAKYIERAQISPNPNSFVSRQSVMQAVEDLQYNLSTHCTGMANVITPLIYAELNFVIQRILMHKEILRQVVPQGGTWWRVVETLYIGMRNVRPRSTVLYNKAKLGNNILRQIADYDASTFEQDGPFSTFISSADAFITTQSILQRGLTEDLIHGDSDGDSDTDHDRDRDRDGDGDASKARESGAEATGAVPDGAPRPPPGKTNGSGAQVQQGDEWAF